MRAVLKCPDNPDMGDIPEYVSETFSKWLKSRTAGSLGYWRKISTETAAGRLAVLLARPSYSSSAWRPPSGWTWCCWCQVSQTPPPPHDNREISRWRSVRSRASQSLPDHVSVHPGHLAPPHRGYSGQVGGWQTNISLFFYRNILFWEPRKVS